MEIEFLTAIKQRNETLTAIHNRHAAGKFKKAINKQLIEELIAAARMTPSAMNKQPWKFFVAKNKELIHTFSNDIAKNCFHAGKYKIKYPVI